MFRNFSLVPYQLTQSLNGYLFEGEGDPGAGAPAAATPAAPAAAPATPSATAPQSATPAASQTGVPPTAGTTQPPATGGPEGWVPSYRVRETREAAMREAQAQYGQREQQLRSELEQMRSQVQALVGVKPQSGQPSEAENIRQQLFQLLPWAKKLEERFGDFEQLVDRAGDLDSQVQHYWTNWGEQRMNQLFAHAEKSLGAPLTPEGKRILHSQFTGFVNSSPEMSNRYAQDPTLVDEYWQSVASTLIDPARRASQASVATRAAGVPAIPRDVPGSAPVVSQAPKPANLDERAANAWAQYQQSAKQS